MKDPRDDGFRWFGEGFDGFPKRLPDDCVEYVVHLFQPNLQESEVRVKLRAIQSAGQSLSKRLLKGFIWERDGFALDLVQEDGSWFLRGRTNYGDSIEDEWLVVYLLRELSRQNHDAWVRIVDNDGEFLLVEAANVLPKWLNPEVAENRVWLNGGELLILPKQSNVQETETPKSGSLSLDEAKEQILKGRSNLLHARLVEEEAFYRLRNYPNQIQENLHGALVVIPRKVAYVLHQNPAYISPAVEALYIRDPISLRPLRAQAPKDLRFAPKDFVTTRVKFTKVGYAKLRSQQFPLPLAWRSVPETSTIASKPEFETGMKLTCGFEMLISDPHYQDSKAVREIGLILEDIDSGETPLPLDSEIVTWGTSGDDESWMDINFRDFEEELSGGAKGENLSGFGDKSTQENLRKMVSRFEEFLNDDTAGMEGAELDDMDEDDDEDVDSLGSSNEGEDKAASFDEGEFTQMMREMMGMPHETMEELMGSAGYERRRQKAAAGAVRHQKGVDAAGSEGDDIKEIENLAAAMEVELKAAGALQLDSEREIHQEPASRSRLDEEQATASGQL